MAVSQLCKNIARPGLNKLSLCDTPNNFKFTEEGLWNLFSNCYYLYEINMPSSRHLNYDSSDKKWSDEFQYALEERKTYFFPSN